MSNVVSLPVVTADIGADHMQVVGPDALTPWHKKYCLQQIQTALDCWPPKQITLSLSNIFGLLVASVAVERDIQLIDHGVAPPVGLSARDMRLHRQISHRVTIRQDSTQSPPASSTRLLAFWSGVPAGPVWRYLHDWACQGGTAVIVGVNGSPQYLAGQRLRRALGHAPPGAEIIGLIGPWAPLSNLWSCDIDVDGVEWASVEHAYQALRAVDSQQSSWIAAAHTAQEARRRGRSCDAKPGWTGRREAVMLRLLRAKFADKYLQDVLLSTGTAHLVDTSDTFWGRINGNGANRLGRMLMQIRSELSQSDGR